MNPRDELKAVIGLIVGNVMLHHNKKWEELPMDVYVDMVMKDWIPKSEILGWVETDKRILTNKICEASQSPTKTHYNKPNDSRDLVTLSISELALMCDDIVKLKEKKNESD